ncbi:Isochorismatase hydrolase [Pseudohyphozyma bogoriensis]|nr:Isochorismatase hydrolase [Pseudohyphozyma bogoriensis]
MAKGKKCLLLIDIQYDFIDGSLAVPDAEAILEPVYSLLDHGQWDLVVASQDHHPPHHISFGSRHSLPPFTSITLPSSKVQELWPDHCIQGERGSQFEAGIDVRLRKWVDSGVGKVVRKGEETEMDEYSAFQGDTDGNLATILREASITQLYVVGLATDFCVRFSATEALRCEPKMAVKIVRECVRGVDPVRSEEILRELESAGVEVVGLDEVRKEVM